MATAQPGRGEVLACPSRPGRRAAGGQVWGGAGEKPRRGVGFWLGQLGGELQLLLKCRSPRRNGSAMGDIGISALAAFRTGMLHPRGWPMGALTPEGRRAEV